MTALDSLIRHRYAQVGDVRLHFVEAGPNDPQAPATVLLHGFPDFWYTWRHQIPALAQAGHRVFALDLRGYNLSTKPTSIDAYAPKALVADITGFIEHQGLQQPTLIGHDWGGLLGWWVAMHAPSSLGRLVILNAPHPAHFLSMMTSPAQLFRSRYIALLQLPWVPERRLRRKRFAALRTFFRAAGVADDAELEHYAQAWQHGSLTGQLNYYRALLRRGRPPLRPIDIPTHVVWGTGDFTLGDEFTEPPTRWVWDYTVDRIQGAGHWAHVRNHDTVNAHLLSRLQPRTNDHEALGDVRKTVVKTGSACAAGATGATLAS